MTLFERDYKAALDGDEVEVLTRRKAEINALEKQLRECRNGFRTQCIAQELDKRKKEYDKIDALF